MSRRILQGSWLALSLVVVACSGDDATSPEPDPGTDVFHLVSPEFTVEPGGEVFLCYHTSLPIAEARAITRYQSKMTAGSHHLILFYVDQAQRPDGTLEECGGGPGGFGTAVPIWGYASQEAEADLSLPDGVAVPVNARQPVILNMHYFNVTEATLRPSVTIDVHALPSGTEYVPARAFVTFNTEIQIPAGESATFGGSCDVPAGAQFLALTTHSHRYTTAARVWDGDSMVIETLDWEHPTVGYWREAPFFEFASGKLDYACDFTNTTNTTLTVGESALENEMCMAGGFYFPAESDVFCLNSETIRF